MRFTQTAVKKDAEAAKKWDLINSQAKPGTKVDLQHKVLTAWVLDPKLGQFFHSQVTDIITNHCFEQKVSWISKKQLLEVYDESEAEELIEAGHLQWRKHPANPKRLQFRKVKETETKQLQTNQKLSIHGTEKFEGDKYQGCVKNLEQHAMVKDGGKQAFKDMKGGKVKLSSLLQGAGGEGSDDEEDESKKKGKKRPLVLKDKDPGDGDKEPAPQVKKGVVEPAMITELAGGLASSKALLAAMDKQLVTAKSLLEVFKGSSFSNPKKQHSVLALIKKSEKANFSLHCVSVSKTSKQTNL